MIPRKITDDKYIFIYLGVVGWPLLTFIISSSSFFLKKIQICVALGPVYMVLGTKDNPSLSRPPSPLLSYGG